MSKLHSTSAWQDAFLLHSSSARGCSAYGPVLILSKHACLCQVVFCTCPQLCALADARQGLALCAVWIYTILSIEMTSPVRRSSKYPPSALTPTAAALPNSRGKTRLIGNHARPSRASATAPHRGGHVENRIRRKRSGASSDTVRGRSNHAWTEDQAGKRKCANIDAVGGWQVYTADDTLSRNAATRSKHCISSCAKGTYGSGQLQGRAGTGQHKPWQQQRGCD